MPTTATPVSRGRLDGSARFAAAHALGPLADDADLVAAGATDETLLTTMTKAAVPSVGALGSGYEHDGKTTYCWKIPQSYQAKPPRDTADVKSGSGTGCPVSMELTVNPSGPIAVGDFVTVQWTVTLERSRLEDNALGVNQYFRITDPGTKEIVDIIHSNLRSCAFGSGCDPFKDGKQGVDPTPNQLARLNGKDTVTFNSTRELRYTQAGEYSLFAHIIMPGQTDVERVDYAVYQRLQVGTGNTTASALSTDSGKLSSATIIIIVAGIMGVIVLLAVLAWFLRRKRKQREAVPLAFFTGGTLDKPYDLRADSEVVRRSTSGNPQMNTLKPAPYIQFGSEASRPSKPRSTNGLEAKKTQLGDPKRSIGGTAIFNRQVSQVHSESTRSFPFEPPVNSDQRAPLPIFSSKNSIDFVYPDTDHPIDMIDAADTGFMDLHDSSRSDDTVNSYAGFLVESDNTAHVYDFEDSERATRVFVGDGDGSFKFEDGLETRALDTNQLRSIKVEI